MPSDNLDEFFWDDLLAYMDERRVIPVIDTGSLLVCEGVDRLPLETLLAQRLAERLRVDVGEFEPGSLRLDDVVRKQRTQPGRKENLYLRIQTILKELDIQPPQALLDLASIDAFDLMVSVSFDDLLTRALDKVRHGGDARTNVIAFAPNRSADLAQPRSDLRQSTVFQLLGRISSAPDSVTCDDDRLEFLHALQDDARRPKLLFDELRDNHLLLLGCRLPDWAARFFLRTVKGERLSAQEGDTVEFMVGRAAADDIELTGFLTTFRPNSLVVPMDTEDFLAQLRRRWEVAHPADEPPVIKAQPVAGRGPGDGAVFISYSRHDSAAVECLAGALQVAGVEVWFDRNELKPGDPWAAAILQGIKNCSLFIPVVSANTQLEGRSRAYFWREWNIADDLALGMAPDERFILPVVVDGTDPYGAKVPARFTAANFTRLPGGEPVEGFVERVNELFVAYRERVAHG
ncbi:toll/interleukin-1 receptor domain-containing protein [Colwellia sp. MB3u-70]|uniref:toll/interleukin-1 receptor domain-containing protein n=1 Tax=unclassified Colwellia TaxID=196834 RepID=UPI0015F362F5|nr:MULTISPECIES: toll/interleukin-1 receptor domain-containing protein [unclassified Colwellia]MBA6292823.1 toll/interleukin-1 receptor domain-containing protein [Colwellia sp. MB3u-8]MBA6308093.1 toll/interleukin-1 receptor domain-containing protein [Colwellia sp. MB3u-70]